MDISSSDGFSYATAIAGASSCSHEMCFYSAATSPGRSALSGFQTEPITPSTYDDASSSLGESEFETSRHFSLSESNIETIKSDENSFGVMKEEQYQRLQRADSFPTKAFSDEQLFCDGKVLPLSLMPPLKLPPRLLPNENSNKMSPRSSTASSPRSPGPALPIPFSGQSLWNDDFDPFLAALENVKEEKKGQLICELRREPLKQAPRSSYMPSQQPKGSVFARQLRVDRLQLLRR